MASEATSPAAQAKEFILHPRFHQEVNIPASDKHDAITLSYADFGRQPENGTSVPTILFIPGMFGTRLAIAHMHPLAEKYGVRVLTVDRFGLGKATDITAIEKRISTWIDILPAFMAHVGVEHASFVSHSAGTHYLLNTLFEHRNVLNPQKPYAALLGPWVDVAQSGRTPLRMLQFIPNKAFGIWNEIPKFLNTSGVLSAFSASGIVFNKVGDIFSSSPTAESSAEDAQAQDFYAENYRKIEEKCGFPQEVQKLLETEMTQVIFQDSTVGANSEALLCLKKGPENLWRRCNDVETYVKDLADLERSRDASGGKLKVDMFFGETDFMIGEKGQAYMERCWQTPDIKDVIDYETTTIVGSNHDSVTSSVDVWERIFIAAGGSA